MLLRKIASIICLSKVNLKTKLILLSEAKTEIESIGRTLRTIRKTENRIKTWELIFQDLCLNTEILKSGDVLFEEEDV